MRNSLYLYFVVGWSQGEDSCQCSCCVSQGIRSPASLSPECLGDRLLDQNKCLTEDLCDSRDVRGPRSSDLPDDVFLIFEPHSCAVNMSARDFRKCQVQIAIFALTSDTEDWRLKVLTLWTRRSGLVVQYVLSRLSSASVRFRDLVFISQSLLWFLWWAGDLCGMWQDCGSPGWMVTGTDEVYASDLIGDEVMLMILLIRMWWWSWWWWWIYWLSY